MGSSSFIPPGAARATQTPATPRLNPRRGPARYGAGQVMHILTQSLRLLALGLMLLGASATARAERCAACQGTGSIPCPRCNGTGVEEWTSIHGQPAAYGCERCGGVRGDPMQGTGRPGRGHIPCPACGGRGSTQTSPAESPPLPRAFTPPPDLPRRTDIADAKRKQDEFDRLKRDLFDRLKDLGAAGGLDLKDSGAGGPEAGRLKGIPESSTSVVDLRHLDPAQPMVVDPDVVRGVSETLRNPHYQAGFDAIRRSDPAEAVICFDRARQDRPDDPLVLNAWWLAQDLLKAHRAKEKADRNAMALRIAGDAIRVIPYDIDLAVLRMREAHALSPEDRNISETLSFIEGIAAERARTRNRRPSQE